MALTSNTTHKISDLVAQQVPDFVRDEGPALVTFMEAYYEFMEQSGEQTERSHNILNYQDIDNTLDQFVQYFKGEVMDELPVEALADKRALVKRIKDLYRARGTPAAYRLFFRMMYGEEIDFYFPGVDILRSSDGRWLEEVSIRVAAPSTGSVSDLAGEIIAGGTSGATAKVERIASTIEQGLRVYEVFVTNRQGNLIDGELIQNSGNTINATIYTASGPLSAVTVTSGGAGHEIGDVVDLTGTLTGTGANGTVITTAEDSSIKLTLTSGGAGYRRNANVNLRIIGGNGTGANAHIGSQATAVAGPSIPNDAFTNPQIIALCESDIANLCSRPEGGSIALNSSTFAAGIANTRHLDANIAASSMSTRLNAALIFTDNTTYSINAITTSSIGSGYSSLPAATITEHADWISRLAAVGYSGYGQNATVAVTNNPGAVDTIRVDTAGSVYDALTEVSIVNQSRSGTVDSAGLPTVEGTTFHPGFYKDTQGFLSWNNKLQDNYYYQEYSYVVRSKQFLDKYRKLAKAIVHPGGTKLFGEYRIETTISGTITTANSTYQARTGAPWYTQSNGTIRMEPTSNSSALGSNAYGSPFHLFGTGTFFVTGTATGTNVSNDTVILCGNSTFGNVALHVNTVYSDTYLDLKHPLTNVVDKNGVALPSILNGKLWIANTY
jgi:hypothetical protein